MSISNIKEIKNSFLKLGAKGPPNCTAFTNTRCFGDFNFSNENHDISCKISKTGAVFAQISKAEGGLGDGMSPTPAGRDKTQNALAGTGNIKVPTLTVMKNPDGTGMTCDSGGGRKPTILMATGDGKNGILITDGFVALYSKGTELIVHGNAGKITSTYHLIQETNKGSAGQVDVKTHSV